MATTICNGYGRNAIASCICNGYGRNAVASYNMLRHTAEHSLVAFHGLATGELTLQLYIRLLGAGEHKESARVHIEAVGGFEEF